MEAREPVDLLIKNSGTSRRAFAQRFGVGEQVLLRLSQGRFTRIPQSVVDAVDFAFGEEAVEEHLITNYEAQGIQDAYAAWRESIKPFGELPDEKALKAQKGVSPAQALAAAVGSMSKLAKMLRVHDYVVRRYVNGETRELPASMRETMERLRWPHTDQLDRAQQAWLDRQGAK